MKASCLRRRHSPRKPAHVTCQYSDLFPLAQWQRPSSRATYLVAKPATPPTPLVLHPGARDGDDRRAASMAFCSRGPQSSAGLVRFSCYGGLNDETCETPKAGAPKATQATASPSAAAMSPLTLKRASA